MTTESWQHNFADANGIRIHYVEQGEGTPVVLIHGFPELWYSWRHQIPALADAGYRAIAVDVRGYGQSGRPAEDRGLQHEEHRGRHRRPAGRDRRGESGGCRPRLGRADRLALRAALPGALLRRAGAQRAVSARGRPPRRCR